MVLFLVPLATNNAVCYQEGRDVSSPRNVAGDQRPRSRLRRAGRGEGLVCCRRPDQALVSPGSSSAWLPAGGCRNPRHGYRLGLHGRLMEMARPVRRHPTGWTRHRLIEWVVQGRSQRWSVPELLSPVVPEPVLAGLEASDQGVAGCPGVLGGVLLRGAVATSNVAAARTTTKVEPPTILREALETTSPAG